MLLGSITQLTFYSMGEALTEIERLRAENRLLLEYCKALEKELKEIENRLGDDGK